MILMFFNTKGGAGKTTAALTFLASIADHNAKHKKQIKAKVFDTDPQGSLATFFERRIDLGLNDLSITANILDLKSGDHISNDEARDLIVEAEEEADIVVVDCAGNFRDEAVNIIFAADLVLVPCSLIMLDADVAMPITQQVNDVAKTNESHAQAKILLTKTRAIASKSAKALREMITEDYPTMKTEIRDLPALSEMASYGLYLHEMLGQGSSQKSLISGLKIAHALKDEVIQISHES